MHKKVLLKSINVCDLHFHRQCAQTAFYSTVNLKCRAASDNNQNSLYFPIRNVHLTFSYSAHSFMLIYNIQ